MKNIEIAKFLGITPVSVANMVTGVRKIKKIHWLAISEENILNYFHKNSKIKARLKILSKSDNRAKELFDKIWS